MLDARKSPMSTILTDDPIIILGATGILSRLWRLLLADLKLDCLKWENNLDDYVSKSKGIYPDVDFSNVKGNLGKALAREEVTWDIYCKGISVLKLKLPTLKLKLTLDDKVETIIISIPFTCGEDRGILLAKAWTQLKKAFPERAGQWEKLVTAYGKKQKHLGRNLTDSLKSNLTTALKSRTIMWSILIKAIEVYDFDKVEISLNFEMTKGSKSIVLNPK